ncbi:MAG: alpha/beta fold hydrolase [Desulfobacterales bacterium]
MARIPPAVSGYRTKVWGWGVFGGSGFDVWIPELRGHGRSPKGADFPKLPRKIQIRYDLPAVQAAVFAATEKPAFWIGHSFGGLFILAALSVGWLGSEKCRVL